jgi:hypothetical protein
MLNMFVPWWRWSTPAFLDGSFLCFWIQRSHLWNESPDQTDEINVPLNWVEFPRRSIFFSYAACRILIHISGFRIHSTVPFFADASYFVLKTHSHVSKWSWLSSVEQSYCQELFAISLLNLCGFIMILRSGIIT